MSSLLQFLSTSKIARRRSLASRREVRYVGIDLDVEAIRIAIIRKQDTYPIWDSSINLSLQENGATGIGEAIDSPQSLECWIQRVLRVLPRSGEGFRNRVAISLPSSWLHYEIIGQNERATATTTCDSLMKDSLFQSEAHTQCWSAGANTDRLMLAAVSKQATLKLVRGIHLLGYEVAGVYPAGIALSLAAKRLTTLTPRCVAYLSRFGGSVSTLKVSSVGSSESGLCRKLPALNTKIRGAISIDNIAPWLDTIAQEIDATLKYSRRLDQTPNDSLPIMLAGPLAAISDIDAAIASRIQFPVAIWRYAGAKRPGVSVTYDNEFGEAADAIALSLAHFATLPSRLGKGR